MTRRSWLVAGVLTLAACGPITDEQYRTIPDSDVQKAFQPLATTTTTPPLTARPVTTTTTSTTAAATPVVVVFFVNKLGQLQPTFRPQPSPYGLNEILVLLRQGPTPQETDLIPSRMDQVVSISGGDPPSVELAQTFGFLDIAQQQRVVGQLIMSMARLSGVADLHFVSQGEPYQLVGLNGEVLERDPRQIDYAALLAPPR